MKTIDTRFLSQSIDQREEMMLFFRSQRRGRLVEYNYFCFQAHSSRDLDHLPLAVPSERTVAVGSTGKFSD